MDTTDHKVRIDRWDATLSDDQRWDAYAHLRRSTWFDFARWAAAEYKLAAAPSRSAIYRWADDMRASAVERRVQQALLARHEAGALANAKAADADTVAAYQALAQDLALQGDAESAKRYVAMAMEIQDRVLTAKAIEIKAAAQATKERELKLAQDKFEAAERRLAAASATVQDQTLTDAERVTKLKELFGVK